MILKCLPMPMAMPISMRGGRWEGGLTAGSPTLRKLCPRRAAATPSRPAAGLRGLGASHLPAALPAGRGVLRGPAHLPAGLPASRGVLRGPAPVRAKGDQGGAGQDEDEGYDYNDGFGPFKDIDIPGNKLVWVSVLFYLGMSGASIAAGEVFGLGNIGELLFPPEGGPEAWIVPATLYMLPMLGMLGWSIFWGDEFDDVKQLKALYADTIVPALADASILGIGAMALGAGVGEELAFRGVMQEVLDGRLQGVVGGGIAEPLALGITALVFGAAHAATRLYFIFATVAGMVFGLEYALGGHNLLAPTMTHFVYDWIALLVLAKTQLMAPPEGYELPTGTDSE